MRSVRVHRLARYTLAVVRLVNGGVGLLAPRLFIGRFDPDRPTSRAAVYAFRLFGVRTVLIALDLLHPDRAQRAAQQGVLIHASDTVTAAALALSGSVPRRTGIVTTAISAGNVVLAVLAIEESVDRCGHRPRRKVGNCIPQRAPGPYAVLPLCGVAERTDTDGASRRNACHCA